jgi:hypothetical protein
MSRLPFLLVFLVVPAFADHSAPEIILPVSEGVYRLPFATGTSVTVTRDHIDHDPHNQIDMGRSGAAFGTLVAAADGWIEYVQDSFNVACRSATDTNPTPCDGYSGPSGSCCVRNSPGCVCRNNYVWMRHPNGEWSKVSHMQQGTVPAALVPGVFVAAGTPLGIEGDVGFASGVHVHFHVGVPDVVDFSLPPGDPNYDPLGINPDTCNVCGFPAAAGDLMLNGNRQHRIPSFCSIGFLESGNTYTAEGCDGLCANDDFVGNATIGLGEIFYRQATNTVTLNNFVVQTSGGAGVKAGGRVRLAPGFHAVGGSYFVAANGACDAPADP